MMVSCDMCDVIEAKPPNAKKPPVGVVKLTVPHCGEVGIHTVISVHIEAVGLVFCFFTGFQKDP